MHGKVRVARWGHDMAWNGQCTVMPNKAMRIYEVSIALPKEQSAGNAGLIHDQRYCAADPDAGLFSRQQHSGIVEPEFF